MLAACYTTAFRGSPLDVMMDLARTVHSGPVRSTIFCHFKRSLTGDAACLCDRT